MTGRVVQCPLDELNRPRGTKDARLRIQPPDTEVTVLFTGCAQHATRRKFTPMARNHAAARLLADVGLRVNDCLLYTSDAADE